MESDDEPLVFRAKPKDGTKAPEVKQEAAAAKAGVVKAEVKPEAKEEGAPGPKAATKGVKEEGKKPAAAKGKTAVKAEEATQNGQAKGVVKKEQGDTKVKKEKKEFDMPGQTREAPPETDALRKFYTSLLEQRPESDMAKRWCLTHGLLSQEVAEELVAQLRKAKPANGAKSPAKPSARSEGRAAAPKARRPSEKAPAAKKQRQAVSPPKKSRAKYSDEEDEASSSSEEEEEEDDDDEPIQKKAAAKPAAKAAAAGGAGKKRPVKGQDKAFTDGGLGSSDEEDDMPLMQRKK